MELLLCVSLPLSFLLAARQQAKRLFVPVSLGAYSMFVGGGQWQPASQAIAFTGCKATSAIDH
jgi:hypothetical protein